MLLALAAVGARAQSVNCPFPWITGAAGTCATPKSNAAAPSGAAIVPPAYAASGYGLDENWTVKALGGKNRGLYAGSSSALPLSQLGREGLERNYAAAQLSGSYWFGRSQFSTRFALLQGEEKLGGFGLAAGYSPEFRNNWSQAAATARYGYWFDGFMPYASLTLASDLVRPGYGMAGAGREAWIPRVGVDFFSRRGVSGGLSYASEQGSAVKNQVWSANVNFRF
jgi:hypothetical protein